MLRRFIRGQNNNQKANKSLCVSHKYTRNRKKLDTYDVTLQTHII